MEAQTGVHAELVGLYVRLQHYACNTGEHRLCNVALLCLCYTGFPACVTQGTCKIGGTGTGPDFFSLGVCANVAPIHGTPLQVTARARRWAFWARPLP